MACLIVTSFHSGAAQLHAESSTVQSPAKRLKRVSYLRKTKQIVLELDGFGFEPVIDRRENPGRLIIDLPGLSSSKKLSTRLPAIALKRLGFYQARVWPHPDHVRVVLDAKTDEVPDVDVVFKDQRIMVQKRSAEKPNDDEEQDSSGFHAPTVVQDEQQDEPLPSQLAELTDIQLQKKEGFYRVRFAIKGGYKYILEEDKPLLKRLVLKNVKADPRLLAEPILGLEGVQSVSARHANETGTIHISMALKSEGRGTVWRDASYLYWDIRTEEEREAMTVFPAAQAAPLVGGLGAGSRIWFSEDDGTGSAKSRKQRGRVINIDLQEADIVQVIHFMSNVSGKNIIVGDDVNGTITLKLKDVPWGDALDVILKSKGLGKEVTGGIIRVAPQATLDQEEKERLALQEEKEKKQKTEVRFIPVNYAVASEMASQVEQVLSERGRVTTDERTNVLIVEDIPENLDQAEKLVQTLDTQTPMIQIEARMVEATTDFSRSLGIQWGGGFYMSQQGGNPTGLVFPSNVGVVGAAGGEGDGVLSPANYAINLPIQNAPASIGMNLGSIGNFGFLNAKISAAENNGEVKTISAPKVTTLNNEAATISQGVSIPITVQTDNVINTIFQSANLSLSVTPQVTADGSILMDVSVNNNAPGAGGNINTKQVQTNMLIDDGDTVVIGGIYTRVTDERESGLPFLNKIPVLGWLFKNKAISDTRSEMLIFLTPRVVNKEQSTLDTDEVMSAMAPFGKDDDADE